MLVKNAVRGQLVIDRRPCMRATTRPSSIEAAQLALQSQDQLLITYMREFNMFYQPIHAHKSNVTPRAVSKQFHSRVEYSAQCQASSCDLPSSDRPYHGVPQKAVPEVQVVQVVVWVRAFDQVGW